MSVGSVSLPRAFALIFIFLFAMSVAAPWSRADLLIHNVTVVSPERSDVLAGRTVRIRENRIVGIESAVPQNTDGHEVIDASGLYLIPGLMDSHLHTSVIPGLGFEGTPPNQRRSDLVDVYMDQLPRSLLYFGVTQFLDPAPGPAGLQRFSGADDTPVMFHCGAAQVAGGILLICLGPMCHWRFFHI